MGGCRKWVPPLLILPPPPPLLVAKRSLGLCLRGSGGCRGAAVLPGVGGFFQRKDRPTAPVTAKPPLVTTPQPPSVTLQPPSVTPRTVEVGLTNASGVFLFSPRTALGGGAGVGGGGGGAHVTDYTSPYGGGGGFGPRQGRSRHRGPNGGGGTLAQTFRCADMRTHTHRPPRGRTVRPHLFARHVIPQGHPQLFSPSLSRHGDARHPTFPKKWLFMAIFERC